MTDPSRLPSEDLQRLGLDLNRAGRRAFPVGFQRGVKKPLIEGYFGDEPFSAHRVTSTFPWDRATHVGLAVPPGCIILDVDVKNDRRGEDNLDLLIREYGPLDTRVQQLTPSGGRHLAFRLGSLEGENLLGELLLPDGSKAGIDVLHASHRYITVYEPDVWYPDHEEWPILNPAWHPAIVRRQAVYVGGTTRPEAVASTPSLEAVLTSRPGERNNVLFRAVCDELRRDPSASLEQFLDAALQVGLEENEARATISSAKRNVLSFLGSVDAWEDAAAKSARSRTSSSMRAVVSVIGSIARRARQMDEVGLGVRQLALESGLSAATVLGRLRDLRKAGLLQMHYDADRMKAQRYRLVVPTSAQVASAGGDEVLNSHAKGNRRSAGLVETSSPVSALQRDVRRLGTELRTRSAFQRAGGGASLPPSCAVVLASVQLGLTTPLEIRKAAGVGRDTVRTALRALTDGCLIDFDEATGTYTPAYEDARVAVTAWESAKRVPDRAQAKLDLYRMEQEAHRIRNVSATAAQPGPAAE